jgi:hypothetical protein
MKALFHSRKQSMKQLRFYLEPEKHRHLSKVLTASGLSLSEFIRQCVEEKIARVDGADELRAIQDDTKAVLASFQEEVLRLRRDLIADQMTAFGAMRDDIRQACAEVEAAARKNEDVNKQFLLLLTQPSQAKPSAPRGNPYYPE